MKIILTAALSALMFSCPIAKGQTPRQQEIIVEVQMLMQEFAAECGGTVPPVTPPPDPPTGEQRPYECYLARYPDVAAVPRYRTESGAYEHFNIYGRNEKRCWYCDGDPRIPGVTPWCVESGGGGGSVGSPLPVGSGFIWKPQSENDGRLVILLPSSFGGGGVTVAGEPGNYVGRTNGDRPTYRFSRPGSAYPDGVRMTYGGQEWCVSNPGGRHENNLWQCE